MLFFYGWIFGVVWVFGGAWVLERCESWFSYSVMSRFRRSDFRSMSTICFWPLAVLIALVLHVGARRVGA